MVKYSCSMKTILLFVLILLVFIILYTQYTPQLANQGSHKLDISQQLRKLDNFLDLIQLTAVQNKSKPVPSEILNDYNIIYTPELRSKILSASQESEKITRINQDRMTAQLNNMDTNMRGILSDINTKLYKQLSDNYERSQYINSVRADWLSNINDLPYNSINL